MIARAREVGVRHIVLPNENLESVPRLVATRDAYPGYISIALGLHPEDVDAGYEAVLAAMRPLLDEHQPVAVGEIGIDLYWDATWRDQQMAALDTQLHWCKELGIPFIIHCRNALDEILSVMDNFGETLPPGVFHSFTGTPQEVEQVRRRGDLPETYSAAQKRLKDRLQSTVEIKRSQRGKGTLTIAFNSDRDFERIMNLLEK